MFYSTFMITIIIFLIVIFFAWYKPPIAFALLLQTNVIRSLAQLEIIDPCYYCSMDQDPILGAILPVLSFIIIIFKIDLKKGKVKYHFDKFDILFVLLIIALMLVTVISYSVKDSILYSLKFLILGFPYYFIVKIYFLNSDKNQKSEVILFFKTSVYLALIFSLLAIFIVAYNADTIWRLTIPKVHPIPFSQLIGLGVLISMVIVLTRKTNLFLTKKYPIKIILISSLFLLLVQFATNTRGVLVSLIVGFFYLLWINPIKIKKIYLYSSIIGFLILLGIVLSQLDLDYYFIRFTEFATDPSILGRLKVYLESFNILYDTHFLGTGPGAFKYFSFLEYPHNLLLENMAVLGILGLLINIYIILLVYWLIVNSKVWKENILLILTISIFLFFFTETMFSFTLWMHKGLYFSMALISVLYHKMKIV